MFDTNESVTEATQGSVEVANQTIERPSPQVQFGASSTAASRGPCRMETRNLDVYYGDSHAIKDVNLSIYGNEVLSIIGPSGCGKSTFLRSLNRINDIVAGCRVTGSIELDGRDIYTSGLDVVELRARVGMVFQKPNPFPKPVFNLGKQPHSFQC